VRDHRKDEAYFNRWIDFYVEDIEQKKRILKQPFANEDYRPQYVFDIGQHYFSLLLQRYSRGDSIAELAQYIPSIVDYWEEAARLGKHAWTAEQQNNRRSWASLDVYVDHFWVVGLALALETPDAEWNRLVALLDNEGGDVLLDRIIAARSPGRKIGTKLAHPKPYKRLLEAIDAPRERQPRLLYEFLDNWYRELDRPGSKKQHAMYERPYWYRYHTLEGGYFGYWCIEAVAAVKAFGIDDSLCLEHPHYPGDLLRPNRPTHGRPVLSRSELTLAEPSEHVGGWLTRLLRRH
jgi:hypothetical protein